MGSFTEKIYAKAPNFIQNFMVTLFNLLAYNKRYSGKYKQYLNHYKRNNNLSIEELKRIQKAKYQVFIKGVLKDSKYYQKQFKNISKSEKLENITRLPILSKEDLRSNIKEVTTISKDNALVSKTGGTTGKSLEVLYTVDDIEERFAILDNFRGSFGYKLGKRTAWFSGKNLLSKSDVTNHIFWKTDYFYKVRYYSTFHIHKKYLRYYLENLIKYKPEFMVGFPSTMYEIAKFGMLYNIDFPKNTIKAIFPTAETITDNIRSVLETYFKTNLYNQYASSEGAPFIFECKNKKLHLELQSGVYEVLDFNNQPCSKGRLVVTSFNTKGTPLIRYDIGDSIELADKRESCDCGNHNPLVKQILGRISDYIYSQETGKINLGNISNCLKGVQGVVKFQIRQDVANELVILIERDLLVFNSDSEKIFKQNIVDRVGSKMNLKFEYVNEIQVEKSGKFRLIKNNLNI